MKSTFSLFAFAAVLAILAGNASTLFAQAPQYGNQLPGMQTGVGQAQPGMPQNQGALAASTGGLGIDGIAVVDVAYIFKKHARFLQQMELMKQKVEAAEAELKRDQDELKRMSEQLKTFQAGSPDYKKL
ncbi:MAG TPA: OmpH family outer membrane protein, partial [Pirellulales bacterium]|nr:OmpH family outer membrane protein [Pirellulales bacterium]